LRKFHLQRVTRRAVHETS